MRMYSFAFELTKNYFDKTMGRFSQAVLTFEFLSVCGVHIVDHQRLQQTSFLLMYGQNLDYVGSCVFMCGVMQIMVQTDRTALRHTYLHRFEPRSTGSVDLAQEFQKNVKLLSLVTLTSIVSSHYRLCFIYLHGSQIFGLHSASIRFVKNFQVKTNE